jgi:hypothetical protein
MKSIHAKTDPVGERTIVAQLPTKGVWTFYPVIGITILAVVRGSNPE